MTSAEGPLLPRRRLGTELRRLRGERTLDEVAKATLISTSKLSRLENGQGVPQLRDVRDLISFYGADAGVAERLRKWTGAGRKQAWWKQYSDVMPQPLDTYIDFESGASMIRMFALSVIPGPLQTPEYARHLLESLPPTKSADQIDMLIEIRQRRKGLLLDASSDTRLLTVIDEAALRRRIGPDATMSAQVDELHELSRRRNVSIQVLPFDAGAHDGLMGMFTVFQFADDIDRDVVSVEAQSGNRYLEEQSDVLEHLRMFDRVSQKALDSGDSRKFLSNLVCDPSRKAPP